MIELALILNVRAHRGICNELWMEATKNTAEFDCSNETKRRRVRCSKWLCMKACSTDREQKRNKDKYVNSTKNRKTLKGRAVKQQRLVQQADCLKLKKDHYRKQLNPV